MAQMKESNYPWRVCIHWSAGPYKETSLDKLHYHYTVSDTGKISTGVFRPENNIPPLRNGRYAAHCGGGNSYTIGVSLRGMAGFKNSKQVGNFPLTAVQCEAAWKFVAAICKRYGIPITPDRVFTHYEFGLKNKGSDSAGKIDILYLPYQPKLKPSEIGEFIRNKINWYLKNG